MSSLSLTLPITIVLAYFLGSIPFGLILTALSGGGDIRKVGSGNIGATNVLRTGKKGIAIATLLLDAAKGAAAVLLAKYCTEASDIFAAMAFASFAAVLGHCFPIWLRFKGGKGVATGLGTIWILSWPVGIICCMSWLFIARLTRISSAGALSAFLVAPLAILVLAPRHSLPEFFLATLGITILICLRHSSNITRLIQGTEPRINVKKTSTDQ